MNYLDRIRAAAAQANAELDERHSGESGRMIVAIVDAKPGNSWDGDEHTVSVSYYAGKGAKQGVADAICAVLAQRGSATPCEDPDCDRCSEDGCTWNGSAWEYKRPAK